MFVRSYESSFMEHGNYVAHKLLLLYVPPILLVIGTFGNLFSFCILMKNAKKSSTYSYLTVLAVMDLLVLYIGLLRLWIGQFTTELEHTNNVLCKCVIFVGYVCSDTSVWLIVAVTVERAAVVMFPLQAPRVCNVRYSRIGIVSILVTFLAVNFHFLWSVELHQYSFNETVVTRCEAAPNHIKLVEDIWPWVDASIYSFFPFILISILNIMIIRQVIKSRNMRNALRQQASLIPRNRMCNQAKARGEISKRLTCMLLSVSFTFLITTLPMNGILIYQSIANESEDDAEFSKMKLLNTVAELLMYTNHSANFFLYCATGRKFRNQFKTLICCCCSVNIFKRFRRSFQRSSATTRMFKMDSYSAPRTFDLACDPVNEKVTPI